ncbi:MAG: secretin N-terminal domain-containing protein [Thermoguttaceae bacterium]
MAIFAAVLNPFNAPAVLAQGVYSPQNTQLQPHRIPTFQGQAASQVHPSPQGTEGPKTLTVTLQNIGSQELEARLSRMMGKRILAVSPAQPGTKSFHLILPNGSIVRLDILPQLKRASIYGFGRAVDSFARLLVALDAPANTNEDMRLVALNKSTLPSARKVATAIKSADMQRSVPSPLATRLFQQPKAQGVLLAQADNDQRQSSSDEANQPSEGKTPESSVPEIGQLGPVQIDVLEGLDVMIIRGRRKDVDQVMNVIKQIEQISAQTEPVVEVYKLKFVDCQSLVELIKPLYEEVFLARQGAISITALVKPNALLLVGRQENVKTVLNLAQHLDQPVSPDTEFHVFRLKHAAAASVQNMLNDFYEERGGLGAHAKVSADSRTNALIVQAAPRDMAELADLINRIDASTSEAVNEIRVIPLEHSLADDLAEIIQDAISAQTAGETARPAQQSTRQRTDSQRPTRSTRESSATAAKQRTAVLRFLTVDAKGKRLLQSGILTDVSITADIRSNALIVSAPRESMELLLALIHELDNLPVAEAKVKVFPIVNGDAMSLMQMLQAFFGGRQSQQGNYGARQGNTSAILQGEATLIPLRIAVDARSNCIIASGSAGDLFVIESILTRLDVSDVVNRKSHVYRLKNSPVLYVSEAINQFLTNVRTMQQQLAPGLVSPFEQIEREVIVVPEIVSNSLIVSATPRFFDEIQKIVEKLDEPPPMVMIQVLLAQVRLKDNEEFGVELGLQDGLLFDRSILANLTDGSGGQVLQPGFLFNNQQLGNAPNTLQPGQIGSQGLSNFALGRTDGDLGYGGFVFSASSESVSVLLRALKQNQRLEVLSRPQIMTLDNQPAYVQVGQKVPTISGVTSTTVGQNNSITWTDVGLILCVTPRISPDGLVAMAIDAPKSAVGPESEGIPVSALNGTVIRSPRIDITLAQTTVSAMDGQTVVLGGLITKNKQDFHRKVPWVGDIPVLGRLFRYDGVSNQRDELLIIMTPHVVRAGDKAKAEELKAVEAARMNWCLCDVIELCDDKALRPRSGNWSDNDTETIYPDVNPRAIKTFTPDGKPLPAEDIPAPPPLLDSESNPTPSKSSASKSSTAERTYFLRPTTSSMQSAQPTAYTPPANDKNAVVPIMYDAQPNYPTTKTPFYR